MKACKQIEEWIVPYVEGTLAEKDAVALELHLTRCASCQKNMDETRIIFEGLGQIPMEEAPPLLTENFEQMLAREKRQLAAENRPKMVSMYWRNAFLAAASIAILLMGYVVGSHFSEGPEEAQLVALQKESERLKEQMTLALLENRSASKRIQAVNYSEEIKQPDTNILEAIIARLQYDENINVRLAAAEALSRFSDNELVKDAFIAVLGTEKNPEVQIAVIQFLVEVQDKRALVPMRTLLDKSEVPLFVKNRVDKGIKQLM